MIPCLPARTGILKFDPGCQYFIFCGCTYADAPSVALGSLESTDKMLKKCIAPNCIGLDLSPSLHNLVPLPLTPVVGPRVHTQKLRTPAIRACYYSGGGVVSFLPRGRVEAFRNGECIVLVVVVLGYGMHPRARESLDTPKECVCVRVCCCRPPQSKRSRSSIRVHTIRQTKHRLAK